MNFLLFTNNIPNISDPIAFFLSIIVFITCIVLTLMIPIGIWKIHKSIDAQTAELKELVETQNVILAKLIDKGNNS